jgi:hypothetical protein
MWRLKDSYVTSEKGKVLEVQGGIDSENRNIAVNSKKNNEIYQ